MAQVSGIYMHYQGNTAQCDAVQQNRELVFISDSGTLRFKDGSGNYWYFGSGVSGGTSGYIPIFNSAFGLTKSRFYESGVLSVIDSNIVIPQGSGLNFGRPSISGDSYIKQKDASSFEIIANHSGNIGSTLYIVNSGSTGSILIEQAYGGTITLKTTSDSIFLKGYNTYLGDRTLGLDTVYLYMEDVNGTGLIQWNTTDDRFLINDDMIMQNAERIYFRTAANSIHSSGTNTLSLMAPTKLNLESNWVKVSGDINTSGFTTYTPSYSTSSGTVPQYSFHESYYKIIGKTVHLWFKEYGDGGNEGSGSNTLLITLPTTISSSLTDHALGAGLMWNDTFATHITVQGSAPNQITLMGFSGAVNFSVTPDHQSFAGDNRGYAFYCSYEMP